MTGIEGSVTEEPVISVSSSPNSGNFVVAHSNISSNNASITLYDVLGRSIETRVINGEESAFSVENSGLYLIVIDSGDGRIATERVVVTK